MHRHQYNMPEKWWNDGVYLHITEDRPEKRLHNLFFFQITSCSYVHKKWANKNRTGKYLGSFWWRTQMLKPKTFSPARTRFLASNLSRQAYRELWECYSKCASLQAMSVSATSDLQFTSNVLNLLVLLFIIIIIIIKKKKKKKNIIFFN